jgi:NAD-dependent deacetylase
MDPEKVGSLSGFQADPAPLWKLMGNLRRQLRTSQPNAAHLALADAERRVRPDQTFTLITQNIDGLHQRAGSRMVIEIHGTVHQTRCSNNNCLLLPFDDSDSHEGKVPICSLCGSPMRPDAVMFGEYPPVEAERRCKNALQQCNLFIAVGTSGAVSPAAEFVRSADYAGARTVLVNLQPMHPRNNYFHEEYLGRAEDLLPILFSAG